MLTEIEISRLALTYNIIQYAGTIFIKDNITKQELRFNKGVLYLVSGKDEIYNILLSGGEREMNSNDVINWIMLHITLYSPVCIEDKLLEEFFERYY
ncbi:hypothetical protein C2125_13460 [Rahnella aquatilis]|jgi:hypothetical protein|nr:hypothetical protein C2125_13460 [Rahnella aquatilis]